MQEPKNIRRIINIHKVDPRNTYTQKIYVLIGLIYTSSLIFIHRTDATLDEWAAASH